MPLDTTSPELEFSGYHQDRNVTVRVYPNRIEWESVTPMRKLLGMGARNTDTLYLRTVTGVGTEKATIGFTHVAVTSAANVVKFRVRKSQAQQIVSALNALVAEQ